MPEHSAGDCILTSVLNTRYGLMVSHKSGGKPAQARRRALRAHLQKPKTDAALGSSLNSGAQPWYPPAKVPAAVAPMLDGVLDSAIYTHDAHMRHLEQVTAARLRGLGDVILSSKQQKLLAKELAPPERDAPHPHSLLSSRW